MADTEHIPFRLPDGTAGTAVVVRGTLPDGRTVIACRNEDEEDDVPVNLAVEQLFQTVCERHGLDLMQVVWVEYTSETLSTQSSELGGWELVTWKGKPDSSRRGAG
jgi:hypothetical protein